MIFRNLVFTAVIVGVISGIVLGLVQQIAVIPTIIAAENFEVAEKAPELATGHTHAQSHHHDEASWEPSDGVERTVYTFLANILSAIGFSLVLLSGMALVGKGTIKTGFFWGLAGYLTFFVAPGLGLHPEIPGMEAANIQGRQGWWITTVCFTGLGLAFIVFGQIVLKSGGVLLLVIPHILGAPQPVSHGFSHPDPEVVHVLEGLAHNFIQATAFANAVFWLAIGVTSGFFINRMPVLKEDSDF